jgi:hypothetical protein
MELRSRQGRDVASAPRVGMRSGRSDQLAARVHIPWPVVPVPVMVPRVVMDAASARTPTIAGAAIGR